jgi:hypothetical protein
MFNGSSTFIRAARDQSQAFFQPPMQELGGAGEVPVCPRTLMLPKSPQSIHFVVPNVNRKIYASSTTNVRSYMLDHGTAV